jgi:hypothetical protein
MANIITRLLSKKHREIERGKRLRSELQTEKRRLQNDQTKAEIKQLRAKRKGRSNV